MASIGNSYVTQGFTPAVDTFSGNGSTVAFTLSRPVASTAQVQVVIDNVPQNPNSAYTISGNTITFTSAPLSGTNNIYVYYTSPINQVGALTQGPTVLGNMAVAGSITSGSTITGTTVVASTGFMLTGLTITSSYSVPSGYSAVSVGPITINSGVTVTVPSGSKWVVL